MKNKFALSLLLVVSLFSTISADARELKEVSKLRIMNFNVGDLFLNNFTDANGGQVQEPKPLHELKGIARPILEIDPDIIVLEEVDNLPTLTYFSEKFLGKGRYIPALIEGNDPRGIDIGFLIKADLPIQLDIESHRDVTWVDPVDNKKGRLFSRDLPVVFIRRSKMDKVPALIVVGNHGRSQRDRTGDPLAVNMRTAQYQAAAEIITGYMKTWPNVPLVMAGDFNTDVRVGSEVKPIRSLLADSFDIMKVPDLDRTSHTFHPNDGPRVLNQLDAIYVSPVLVSSVTRAGVYRYKDNMGRELPLPKTFDERELNPSDHYPVAIELTTERIFPEAHATQPAVSGF